VQREAAWFYGSLGGRIPAAGSPARRRRAAAVEAALQAIPAFHRGALSLWHTEKTWPPDLRKEFGIGTSLVVRLECALHPSVGVSTEVLEAAAVERISALLARAKSRDEQALARLAVRADRHYYLAIRLLAKARAAIARRSDEAPASGVILASETSDKESA
jgi:hypothetical protein